MPITTDNAIHVELDSLDFAFLLFAEATFFTDDVDITSFHCETLDGAPFELSHQEDIDLALEQWVEATVDAMAEQVHQDWLDDCRLAGVELCHPDSPFYP